MKHRFSESARIVASIVSSPAMLVWMVAGWCGYYIVSAIWLEEAFGAFVAGLRDSAALKIPYVLFLISLLGNVVRVSRDRIRKGWADFLLWAVLPAGLLIYFTALFLSIATRQSGDRVFAAGDIVQPPWSDVQYRVSRIDLGIPQTFLDIDLDDQGGIFQYEPGVYLEDHSGHAAVAGAFPPAYAGGSYYHILNFGVAPFVRMMRDGTVTDESYVPLKIVAPGTSDTFEIPGQVYRFQVALAPVRKIEKGDVTASEFAPFQPHYSVRVYDGEQIVAETKGGREVRAGDISVVFDEPIVWVQIEAVQDRWYPMLVLGLGMVAAGLFVWIIRLPAEIRKRSSVQHV